jgi:DDE superfamily endonuclease
MTTRHPVPPAPGPLEAYAVQFDDLFSRANQRHAFRQYLKGLLLPAERNKTVTAIANTEPIVGAQHRTAQAVQWFLSESTWDPDRINTRRLALLRDEPLSAPHANGVLVIDEHGDRKWGTKTAHVGKQYIGNLGKIEQGVVSVTSLFADEQVYYPLHVIPYTPARHFPTGKADPQFRTKLVIARELVDAALEAQVPFRAVVADCFYGEDEALRQELRDRGVEYVLALKPSHAWWHREGEHGSLGEVAQAASWTDATQPGDWVQVVRSFRDGHTETWWALEVMAGPYGPECSQRAVVVTTDPQTLPEHTTWYLVTTLPASGSARATEAGALPAADLAEIVRLYGLRNWVEQSYKQTRHALGWGQYQVREDVAIRRHWQLVCCAFSFCWQHQSQLLDEHLASQPEGTSQEQAPPPPPATESAGRGENREGAIVPPRSLLAGGPAAGAELVGAVGHARALLARMVDAAPTAGPASTA